MNIRSAITLVLGILIFSFTVASLLIVPFINLLYKLKMLRRNEGKGAKKQSLFDKLHDKKAGTPTGGGILIIAIVCVLFAILFPLTARMGVYIKAAYDIRGELFVIFFTFIGFGLLGLLDDVIKTFGKPRKGALGAVFGLTKQQKFGLQLVLSLMIAYILYRYLGIHILHIPLFEIVLDLGVFYVPFAAMVIVFFTNAFNFTDGLDGLASGLLLIYLFSFIVISAGSLDTPLFVFLSLWVGAIIAFLYFNVWPARVWLGDAGALSFGAMIAVVGLLTGNIASMFVIGGAFVIEAISSVIQILGWKILKRPIFPIAPIHHSFLVIGWEESKIVMRAWLVGLVLAIFGLWLAFI